MHVFLIKGAKEQKCWIKLIQNLRWLIKILGVPASTESFNP